MGWWHAHDWFSMTSVTQWLLWLLAPNLLVAREVLGVCLLPPDQNYCHWLCLTSCRCCCCCKRLNSAQATLSIQQARSEQLSSLAAQARLAAVSPWLSLYLCNTAVLLAGVEWVSAAAGRLEGSGDMRGKDACVNKWKEGLQERKLHAVQIK
eukprot:scaffold77386_cov21-Tisochrysis_lutea.AAC.1